ncbi:predicted protein [Lichtheimia corymbifera JMRC:FSU:9682]|uniref:Uncharacterized protein n=1 Tax=Lichtheimia corymbifera JMRC:FSU:9682 TaxID=1263082 RepID=A0A068S744_9FUNG|nr:predicted protein [Lichtheimia corymbifera JMRC:FSU:9682]
MSECLYARLKETWIVASTSICYDPVGYVWARKDDYAQRQDLEEAKPNEYCWHLFLPGGVIVKRPSC